MTSFLAHIKTLPETAAASLAKYFDGQMKSRSRWAHCYRSNVLTLMASSTQRIESVNAQVGKACSGSTTFARLCVSLESIVVDAEDATSNSTFSRANSILLDTCITELNNRDGVKEIESQCRDHLSKKRSRLLLFITCPIKTAQNLCSHRMYI